MRNLLASVLIVVALAPALRAGAQAVYLYVPIRDPDVQFRADQADHDAWVNRANTRCRAQFETVRAQHVCMKQLRAESDRRQCEIYRRLDLRRHYELGIESDVAGDAGC